MTDDPDPNEPFEPDTDGDDLRIQRRAYEIWEQEGRPEGRALDHWTQAEQEIRADRDEPLKLAEGEIASLADTD